jgi:mono/diheme cytochrome c family protein
MSPFWTSSCIDTPWRRRYCVALVAVLLTPLASSAGDDDLPAAAKDALRKYCLDCHGSDPEAGIQLEQMTTAADFARRFKEWNRVIRAVRQGTMPPKDAPQPTRAERTTTAEGIERALQAHITRHAGDPGPVVLRRLTSAEYGYTIADLTGLELNLERTFVSDAVGGEGFTNIGSAQFIDDATLERYLEAARTIADHAVVGAGPLTFFEHPGKTGRELSAINRVKDLYRQHGFRTAAGEGAEPFGLELYPRAMFVAWRFRHREALGLGDATLADLAAQERLSVRLCEHVSSVLNSPSRSFPKSAIIAQWQSLPKPGPAAPPEADIRAACERIAEALRQWQSLLAAASGDEEEAAVLTASDVQVRSKHSFAADLDWADGSKAADIELSVSSASQQAAAEALVLWRLPRIRFVRADNRRGEIVPLRSVLAPESIRQLDLGHHPAKKSIGPDDFVLAGESKAAVRLVVPEGMIAARLFIDVELDLAHGADAIVRCRISDGKVPGETAAETGETATLLGNPASPAVAEWQRGVAEFARLLPEVSHREPAPSDRDPIPPPYDNTYNMPERNHFHYAIKYHRDDRFLVEHVLDDPTRAQLDVAWTDLLTSFEYHDANLRFVAKKYAVDLGGQGIADLGGATVDRFPAEVQRHVRRWQAEHGEMQRALVAAEPRHVDDAIRLAERAWRRPLGPDEQQRLRAYYAALRRDENLDHTQAIRSLLARILVAPAFLYRAEPSGNQSNVGPTELVALSDWELASRLSYFLWSSLPDDELTRAAAAGELRQAAGLERQARRMVRDPKARRLAAEFFGQWLGFYRFAEHRGIDAGRFPELTPELKGAMHDEAIAFFEHIIREDRPIAEILFADYTFANAALARYYGLAAEGLPADRHVRVADVAANHRGGLLGLGAILSVTSAPLRTSAVKRGDWVLRRVMGTPVPPPPADAGSIAADDATTDGLTVRQRLEAHRTNRSCVNCHARIDPLGFALEHYDPIGRWREAYRDGQPIDAAGVLSDGTKINGLEGLRQYLRREQPQFERNLCSKLLGYALGRAEMASDQPLIGALRGDLQDDGTFGELVVRIATSQQFRYRRNVAATASAPK